jgi:hypothetical protein
MAGTRRRCRNCVARSIGGDGRAVIAALRERPLESVLQLAGACLDALRERMAEGDEELALRPTVVA